MLSDLFHSLGDLGVTPAEKIIRTIAVYIAIALLLRLVGKRDLGQFNSFDLVVIFLLSNVVQNAIIGPDNSLLGGLLGAAVLVGLNQFVGRASARSQMVERILVGSPTEVVRDGELLEPALHKLALTPEQLGSAIRHQGVSHVKDIQVAELQPSGALDVKLVENAEAASRADINELLEEIRSLRALVAAR